MGKNKVQSTRKQLLWSIYPRPMLHMHNVTILKSWLTNWWSIEASEVMWFSGIDRSGEVDYIRLLILVDEQSNSEVC